MTPGSLLNYKLRFFFDYGAGGCLWAADARTRNAFGLGPIDYAIAQKTSQISNELLLKIDELDLLHGTYLNQNYQADPSPWTQQQCKDFNKAVDELFITLKMQLLGFELIDEQERYSEDKDLQEYLVNPEEFRRNK